MKGIIMKALRLLCLASAAVVLAACANQSASTYTRSQTMMEQSVRMGVVESVRPVNIEGTQSGIGAATGAAVGGIGGSNAGEGKGSIVGAVAGAVIGGIAGNAVEKATTRTNGLEITVKLENGQSVAIVQATDEEFRPGERVRLITGGGTTRVAH